jgi:hypothetical protein
MCVLTFRRTLLETQQCASPLTNRKNVLLAGEVSYMFETVEFFIHEYTLYTVAVSLLRGSKERC